MTIATIRETMTTPLIISKVKVQVGTLSVEFVDIGVTLLLFGFWASGEGGFSGVETGVVGLFTGVVTGALIGGMAGVATGLCGT